jgi:hypothetical protein
MALSGSHLDNAMSHSKLVGFVDDRLGDTRFDAIYTSCTSPEYTRFIIDDLIGPSYCIWQEPPTVMPTYLHLT